MPSGPQIPQEKKNRTGRPNVGAWLWYAMMLVILLWVWQSFLEQDYLPIPYSEFKHYLALGQVTKATVSLDEIVGHIEPARGTEGAKPAAEAANPVADSKTGGAAKAAQADSKRDVSATEKATEPPAKTAKPEIKSEAKPESPASDVAALPELPADRKITGPTDFRTARVDDPDLVKELERHQVVFQGAHKNLMSELLLAWLLPVGLVVAFWVFLSRRIGSVGQTVMSFGKSRARVVADKETGVTFADVAGCDEAKQELEEVVDFLKAPQRFVALGAKIPKGVLLIGPPGTGKTLLARAVAGEAHVRFFSLSGSEFVEMFVGVGASRVRDLFEQAKASAPCIIFIDEMDAIGRERGVHMGAVNDEREQTLNQLLVEMDGFQANNGVILLAATNRPEVLDKALMRPGRFDRQVLVDAPDLKGREAILKIHARGKPLSDDVDLRRIAQATPGFSGADLANVMNEAALLTARRDASALTERDLEEAVEKVMMGPERKSRLLGEEEKRRVAYHEVGHALVSAYGKHADRVHKISIVPRGRSMLGYTFQRPNEDQFLMTQSELLDSISGLLGGRASEEVVFNEVSSGAANDLERATTLARQMVCVYGMSSVLGLAHTVQHRESFMTRGDGVLERDCSEQTAQEIDEEVKKILDLAYSQARQILTEHRDQLELVTGELLKNESLTGVTFYRLIGKEPAPGPQKPDLVPPPVAEL